MNFNLENSASGQQGLSGRMVSFSFKVEKSQLLSPKQSDYVIVNQDGSHCGGSVKFNGIVETSQATSASVSASFPSTAAVKCEMAPEYKVGTDEIPRIKNEPQDYMTNQLLNDSGFTEMDPRQQEGQTVVPKVEPGLGQ